MARRCGKSQVQRHPKNSLVWLNAIKIEILRWANQKHCFWYTVILRQWVCDWICEMINDMRCLSDQICPCVSAIHMWLYVPSYLHPYKHFHLFPLQKNHSGLSSICPWKSHCKVCIIKSIRFIANQSIFNSFKSNKDARFVSCVPAWLIAW